MRITGVVDVATVSPETAARSKGTEVSRARVWRSEPFKVGPMNGRDAPYSGQTSVTLALFGSSTTASSGT
jgi:hypothetical protein